MKSKSTTPKAIQAAVVMLCLSLASLAQGRYSVNDNGIRVKADGTPTAQQSKRPLFGPRPLKRLQSDVKHSPLSRMVPNNTKRQPLLTTPDGVQFMGVVVFANSWQEFGAVDDDPYYVAQFTDSTRMKLQHVKADPHFNANGGGVIHDGVFRFITYFDATVMVAGSFYEYDTNTWEQLRYEDVTDQPEMYAFDTDLDRTTGRVYGCFYNDSYIGYEFGWIDYDNLEQHKIADLDKLLVTIAVNSKGNVYAISIDGDLCRVDKYTGKVTVVGNTGLSPYYVQSATFDKRTDKLYWAASFQNSNSALYQVDTLTAKVTKIANFPDNEEVCCLTVVEPQTDNAAPAKADGLKANFPKGALTGEVSFKAPLLTYGGDPLEGQLNYEVKANGSVVANGQCAPGEEVTADATVKQGEAVVNVNVSNDKGTSPTARLYFWAGPDYPKAVSSLKLSIDSATMKSTLTWRAPTAGQHDGYVSAPKVTYNVVRYPGGVKVATGLKKQKFEETLERQKLTSYYYTVTPIHEGLSGATATSNKVLVGDAFTVPYIENFDNSADFDLFTVIDKNQDGIRWKYSSNYQCAYCSFTSTQGNDDWLLTPELKLEGGRKYNLSYVARRGMEEYPQMLGASFGRGLDVDNYTEVVPVTTLASSNFQRFNASVKVASDGNYHFGFHDMTTLNSYRTYLDSIHVTAGPKLSAPDSVTNMRITIDPEGYGEATLAFNAPTTDIGGNALNSISRIEIYRKAEGDHLIKTFDNVAPGQQLTFTDSEALNGFNIYTVTAYAGEDAGEPYVSPVYVGIDTSLPPAEVKATADNSKATLTWSQSPQKGLHGGYVDVASLTYNVYKLDLSSLTFVPEQQYINGFSYQPAVSMSGSQDLQFFGVTANSELGESDYAVSNVVITGQPYKLPFMESFTKGRLDNELWWSETEHAFVTSNGYNSADEYMGSADWTPETPNEVASLNSGKIALDGAENPVLHFSHSGQPGSKYKLTLNVMTPDNELHPVKTIDYSTLTGDRRWIEETVDMKPFAANDFVVLKFLGECNDETFSRVSFDKVELLDVKAHNLMAKGLNPDLTGTVGKPMKAAVKVRNIGRETERNFKVELTIADKVVGSIDGGTLASFADSTYTLTFVPKIENSGQVDLGAQVTSDLDLDESDNKAATVKVNIKEPELPVVTTLTASETASTTLLEWEKPESDAKSFTEDFETFTPWSIDAEQNGWTLLDVDTLRTIGIEGLSWNNMGKRQAYIAFDPADLGVTAVNRYKPHSGNIYMASFAAYSNDENVKVANDDWLISPELEGNRQTISLWAKAASAGYSPESFELLYSTTGKEVDDFTEITSYDVAADKWYEFAAVVPEGTKYFAIRCVSEDKFALFIDDVTYHKGHVSLTGYNVYRNGVKIGSTNSTQTSFTDNSAGKEDTYTVTVVYDEGESAMSNEACVLNAIATTTAGLLQAKGGHNGIDITNPERLEVSVYAIGGQLVASNLNADNAHVAAAPGIYLVKGGNTTLRVIVR